MTTDKVLPPHSEDAERAVLSAALQDEHALLSALSIVDTGDFFRESHRLIWGAMVSMLERGQGIDPVSLGATLTDRGELKRAGDKEHIGFLLDVAPDSQHIEQHARIVREKADRRRLIERLREATTALFGSDIELRTIAGSLQSSLLTVASQDRGEGFVRVKDDIWPLMEALEAQAKAPDGVIPPHVVPTGYPEIDDHIAHGLERGEFVVIAGVPGGCKTALAMNVALNVALPHRHDAARGVLFVSAEMTRRKLHLRNVATVGRINFTTLRKAAMRDDDWPRLARAAGILGAAPLWVDQTPTPAIEDVVAKCRKQKADHPMIALVVVDFIQLVQRAQEQRRSREDNRAAELTTISYALKGLAKELDVAVIATCQVDAADIEKRGDKRPKPGDARWSQGMREAADLWVSCYRDKMYNPDPTAHDTLELMFQKARDAEPFNVLLDWNGNHMLLTSARQRAEAVNG